MFMAIHPPCRRGLILTLLPGGISFLESRHAGSRVALRRSGKRRGAAGDVFLDGGNERPLGLLHARVRNVSEADEQLELFKRGGGVSVRVAVEESEVIACGGIRPVEAAIC